MLGNLLSLIVAAWMLSGGNVVARVFTTHACPGETLSLMCGGRTERLVVREAFYGPSAACPGIDAAAPAACQHPDPVGSLARSCHGKHSCLISPAYKAEVFGLHNPCVDRQELYTSVQYDCVKAHAIKTICEIGSIGVTAPGHGYVTSVNYPDDYYNNQTCGGVLRGRPGQLNIAITLFDLEMEYSASARLCYDFVVFKQAGDRKSIRTYCGNRRAPGADMRFVYPLNMGIREVIVKFESSIETRFRGFLFEYTVIGCATADLPVPPVPHGRLAYVSASKYAEYTCPAEYRLVPPEGKLVVCAPSGVWEGEETSRCVPLSRPKPTRTTKLRTAPLLTTTATAKTEKAPLPTTPLPTSATTTTTMATTTTTTASTPGTTTIGSPTKQPKQRTATKASTPSPTNAISSVSLPGILTPLMTTDKTPYQGGNSVRSIDTVTAEGDKTAKPVPSSTVAASVGPVLNNSDIGSNGPVIGAIVCGMVLVLLLVVFLFIVIQRYYLRIRLKKKRLDASNKLASLRPSAHACVSRPDSYAGNGYSAVNLATYFPSYSQSQLSCFTASSSKKTRNKRGISHCDPMIYDFSDSMKGSADPILTTSSSSFDCVDIHQENRTLNVEAMLDHIHSSDPGGWDGALCILEGHANPAYCDDEAPSWRSGTVAFGADVIDSDLIYGIARPSLDTIHEECEGSLGMIKPTESQIRLTLNGHAYQESSSEFGSERQDADGQSNVTHSDFVDVSSLSTTVSADMQPKVGKKRIRTRPVSMGEADQPEAKRRFEKVEYGLFKDDITGNLDNFLHHRRVSV